MLQQYTELVRGIMNQEWDTSKDLDFEVGPDDRYYLTGDITNQDLAFRNQMGFNNWDEARRFANSYGYNIPWEV